MNWYKMAITQKQFYEFYGYSGLSKEDLKDNPTLLYNMIEHLNHIREYYLEYLAKEISEELEHARYDTRKTDDEILEEIDYLIEDFSYDDFEKAVFYFTNLLWSDEGIGGVAWAELTQWADKLYKIGEIPQQSYTPKIMQHILDMTFIIDTIHSLQHNTNIALIDLPENEKEWLGVALEVAKHTRTPYSVSQLSGNKELMQYLRDKDKMQQLPTKGHADIYVDTFEKLIQNYLQEKDEIKATQIIHQIDHQMLAYMNADAGAYFAQALQRIINKDPYPSVKMKLSSLLKIIAPYIGQRKWFRHNLSIFQDYLNVYQSLFLDDVLIGDMMQVIYNQNKLAKTLNEYDYFTLSKPVYDYLMNSKYAWMLEGFEDVEE
jgi:hypothetical protein